MSEPDPQTQEQPEYPESEPDSISSSDSEPDPEPTPVPDPDSDSESNIVPLAYVRSDGTTAQINPNYNEQSDTENTPESNIKSFNSLLNSKSLRKEEEEELDAVVYHEDKFDFPKDTENWTEEDLKELWADAPVEMTKPGWDPAWLDEEEVEIVGNAIREGRDVEIAPFYVPYRRPYPAIPDNHYDIANAKSVIEEMDRIEEFLTWVSFIFPDGSSYEGTVWDDLAHGKGVYVAEQGLVRYEGEWLQNNMEGHGVVEVDIPTMQPIPGSKLEAKMRAEGKIITRDFMSPEDREWLEKDIEDSVALADGEFEIPFYENDEWIRQFGKKPEKGRYRYAGQWKHGRMHGCGVYEVNERTLYGRFYFGEHLEDKTGCDADVSGLHAGIAEVAAAKARMFVNKPDGMVREYYGPYSDPQHPYMYEEDDVWMAPGFINQFYEVPDHWKYYVHEVDEEREMWLNSFYRAPLRLPMPSELEHWWSTGYYEEKPEFVLINKEPEPDPNDPSKKIYTEDPLILHTPTGRIINYIEDEEHGVRLFWQPTLKEGEDVDPDKIEFLPTGFDEFYGIETDTKKSDIWSRLVTSVESKCKPMFEKLDKWTEEKKKASEIKMELLKKELELVDAELSLKEAMEDFDAELKRLQKEEEAKAEEEVEEEKLEEEEDEEEEEENPVSESVERVEKTVVEDEEEEDEDETAPSSFGSIDDRNSGDNDQKGSSFGKSTFAAISLSLGSSNLVSLVPSNLQNSFSKWKEGKIGKQVPSLISSHQLPPKEHCSSTLSFPRSVSRSLKLRYKKEAYQTTYVSNRTFKPQSRMKTSSETRGDLEQFNILSLHTPVMM